MGRILALACTLVAVAPGAVRVARAEHPEGKQLFDEGRALAAQGKYAEACELYARSYEIDRAPGTMLNLGDCAEREGKLRRAWLLFDAAATQYAKEQKDSAVKFARGRADALLLRLTTVTVRVADPRVPDLIVRIGDHAAPPAPEIVERLDPGEIPILISAPGHESFSTTVSAAGGAAVVVEVPPLVRRPSAPPPPPRDEPIVTRRLRSRVLLAAGVAGAGVIALGAGGALAWSADRLYDRQFSGSGGEPPPCTRPPAGPVECSPSGLAAVDRARARGDLATAAVIAGSILAVAGAVLYVTAPRERVSVGPIAGVRAAGIGISGRF